MTWRSIIGVLASVLTVVAAGAASAVAQTPAAPTTVAEQPAEQSKDEPKAAGDEPKAEKPTVQTPAAQTQGEPADVKPKPEKPKPAQTEPKPEKPKPAGQKPAQEKPKPDKPLPTQQAPKPQKPKPEKPKAPQHEPAGPLHAEADAPSAAAADAGPTPPAAHVVSPRPRATQAVAGSRARHVTTPSATAGEQPRKAARDPGGPSGPDPSDPVPTGGGGTPADAALATHGRSAVAPTHAPRLASGGAVATAAASDDRREPGLLPLDASRPGHDLTLLLAILFTAAVAFLLGQQAGRSPALTHLRGRSPRR